MRTVDVVLAVSRYDVDGAQFPKGWLVRTVLVAAMSGSGVTDLALLFFLDFDEGGLMLFVIFLPLPSPTPNARGGLVKSENSMTNRKMTKDLLKEIN